MLDISGPRVTFLALEIYILHDGVKTALEELKAKVLRLESGGGPGGVGGYPHDKHKQRGYLPVKSMVPWTMKDDVTQWRRWKAKVLTYTEYVTPGMKSS